MTISEVLLKNSQSPLVNMIPLSEIVCESDKVKHENGGKFSIGFTVDEWKDSFPALPVDKIFYAKTLFPTMVYYDDNFSPVPIFLDLNILGKNAIMSEGNTVSWAEEVAVAIHMKENDILKGNVLRYLTTTNNELRFSLFAKYASNVPASAELYEMFLELYRTTDYGFSGIKKNIINKILSGKTVGQIEETERSIAGLPDLITIYRGQNDASTPYQTAYSWTLDINVAYFFAARLGKNSQIVRALVRKTDIIEFMGGDEQEIIVFPDRVKSASATSLYHAEHSLIQKSMEKYGGYYGVHRQLIRNLYRTKENSGHDALHSLRVLLYTLCILSTTSSLSENDVATLCLACAYHDISRTHDGDDRNHGKESAKIFKNINGVRNRLAEFCIHYHCIDDTEAQHAVSSWFYNKREQKHALLMLNILKDADALDRVRFGIRSLDVNFLRIPISRKLVPFAVECQKGIEL